MQLLSHVRPEDKAAFLQWLSAEYSLAVAGSKDALECVAEEGKDQPYCYFTRT